MGASNSIDRPAPDSSEASPPPKTDSIPSSVSVSMSDSASKPQSEDQPPPQPQSDTKPSEEEAAAAKPKGDDAVQSEEEEEEDEEEKGECGFCLYMKGGGCKESFVAWENCIEEAEKTNEDIAQKCFDLTSALRTCMLEHSDYYEPILRAEKAAEEEAIKELDKEKKEEKEKEKEKEVVIELENEKAPASKVEESSGGKQ
ncbi:hypothetical protein RchiOBHm_Chr1g0342011 [Rosa chinensis]|uniref:GCK domain-containing protein n=1 Tax=Rosa chinensis TaxID=74649 RepID=A0A2P6SDW7_ROSCH|nr:protein SCARECROW 2 [Rosa chinensis]PRQ56867.1 hypothetical protein RchiOBHm_Chr1g0342011 [Rosa chinensis]